MANPLRPSSSPSGLLAAVLLLISAPSISGWIPRLALPSARGIGRTSGRSAERRRVSLAVGRVHDDDDVLLLSNGEPLADYVARLEDLIVASDFTLSSGDEERVVLGDWREGDEGTDDEYDQCDIPEEYKVAGPAAIVDVLSFLGLRRAEPLRIEQARDWE